MSTRTYKERGGFTIVEVVVAMGLLLLGMTSILGMLSFGAALSRTAALRNEAASAVEAVVADLEESFFPLIVDAETGLQTVGAPVAITGRPVPGHGGILYSAKPSGDPFDSLTPGGPLRYRVDIQMSWMNSGARRSKTFTTLLLREVPFGERLRRQFVRQQSASSRPAPKPEAPQESPTQP